jgi:hypothetical protein
MKTLTVNPNVGTGAAVPRREILRKTLLASGIVSSLLYVAALNLGAIRWEGYSATAQTVSELIAINAPSAPLVVPLFLAYSVLIFAFGFGVWLSAGQKRVMRIAALLIAAKEVLGVVVTLFAPIHLRGVEPTQSDTMHAILTGISVLLIMFPAIVLGALAFGKRFRVYSIVTMLVFLVFGILTGTQAPLMALNQPTPWIGVFERINIFGYLLWIIVLAVILLRQAPAHLRMNSQL